jgi:hypothetical protein
MKGISSKALLWIINISLFIYCIGGILVAIFYSSGKFEHSHFLLGLGARQNYPLSENVSMISTTNPHITDASLVATKIAISFSTTSLQLKTLFLSLTIFQILYVGFMLFTLKRIVKSLQTKSPFSIKTIYHLRILAILLLLIEPFDWLGDLLKEFIINSNFSHAIGDLDGVIYKLGYWLGLNVGNGSFMSSWITAGFIVLLLVEVFKQGLKIKEEQDLTI